MITRGSEVNAPPAGSAWRRRSAIAMGFLLFGGLFVLGVRHEAAQNQKRDANDQGAYGGYVIQLHHDPARVAGDRNRMPIYPWLVSTVTPRDASADLIFRRGKLLSAVLSLVGLVALWVWLRRKAGLWGATAATLIVAFTVYVFKAPYLQSEPLFYFLFAVAGWALVRVLQAPSAWRGALAGLAVAIAHLTKAGIAPMVLCFAVALLWVAIANRRDRVRLGGAIAASLSFILLLALTVLPYAVNSQRHFGSALYNENSTYDLWVDSWANGGEYMLTHGAQVPDGLRVPPSRRPSPGKYFREHSIGELVSREAGGLWTEFKFVFRSSVFARLWIVLGSVTVGLAVWQRPRALGWVRRNRLLVGFGTGTGVLYILLYGWWMPISQGNRFVLTLFIPTVAIMTMAIERLGRPLPVTVAGRQTDVATVAFAAIAAAMVPLALQVAFTYSTTWYGGY